MPENEIPAGLFGPIGTPLAAVGAGVGSILGGLQQREANTQYSNFLKAWSSDWSKMTQEPDPAVREQMARKLNKSREFLEKHPGMIAPLMRQAEKASDEFKQAVVAGYRPDATPAEKMTADNLIAEQLNNPEGLKILSQYHELDFSQLSPEENLKLSKSVVEKLTQGVKQSFISQSLEGFGAEELPPEAKEAVFRTGGDIPAARDELREKFQNEHDIKEEELEFKQEERKRAKLKPLTPVEVARHETLAKEGIRKIDLALQALGKGTGFDAIMAQKVPGLNVPFKQAMTDVLMNRLFIKSGANVPTAEDIKQEKATIDLFQNEEELQGTLQDIRTFFEDSLKSLRRGTSIEKEEGEITPSAVKTKERPNNGKGLPDLRNILNLRFGKSKFK